MSNEQVYFGVPPASLLPAKDYKIRTINESILITVPRRGSYKDIDSESFSEADGGFDLLHEGHSLYMPSITKLLFAEKKYPELASNQLFVIVALDFEEDTVDIYGSIIEILPIS